MKTLLTTTLLTLAFILTASAATDTAATAIFNTANEAYDRGDFAIALDHYRELMKHQPGAHATWYNAANAAFRHGSIGEAVLYYRRAWWLNPRDPDILANLQLAQQRTGAFAAEQNLLDQAAFEFSQQEWKNLFLGGFWLAVVTAAIAILLPAARRFLAPVMLVAATLALTSLAGWARWHQRVQEPEAVVRQARQTARYEPREQATPFFALPEGSIVRVEETFDQWVKVRADGKAGWLQATVLEQVNAWQQP